MKHEYEIFIVSNEFFQPDLVAKTTNRTEVDEIMYDAKKQAEFEGQTNVRCFYEQYEIGDKSKEGIFTEEQ